MATSLETCADQIPPALQELMTIHDNMLQIAKYCKDAYATEDQATVFGQTKQYTNDALLNVAYHVHKVSLHLTQYLELQSRELEQLDVRVHHLNNVRVESLCLTPLFCPWDISAINGEMFKR